MIVPPYLHEAIVASLYIVCAVVTWKLLDAIDVARGNNDKKKSINFIIDEPSDLVSAIIVLFIIALLVFNLG